MQGGFLATLDWSQAYDRMRPEATMQALQLLGFPAPWVALLSPRVPGGTHDLGHLDVRWDQVRGLSNEIL